MENNDRIDQLFKGSFEKLPAHSTGGWDKPSAKVWEHIEAEIQNPGQSIKGNAAQSNWLFWVIIGLISAISIVALWYLFQPKTKTISPSPEPIQIQPNPPVATEKVETPLPEKVQEKEAPKVVQNKKTQKPALTEEVEPTFRNNIEKSRAEERKIED